MSEELDKYFAGELNGEEKEAFLRKVEEDEALKEAFVRTQNLMALSSLVEQKGDYDRAQVSLFGFKQDMRKAKRKKFFLNFAKYAAAIVLLIASTWFVSERYFKLSSKGSFIEIEVPKGHRTFLRLDDGSTVWLNSRSKLRYPSNFNGDERVVLLDGEAFFSVEKDESKPFIVKTSRYDVEVLGTKFRVLNYSEKTMFETTLLEGSVKVFRRKNKKDALFLDPNEQVVMKNGILEKRTIEKQDISLWENGYFVFDNEVFEDIIRKLELYYDVKFVIRNEKALYNRYTGNFNANDGIIEILEAIQKVQKFSFDLSSDHKIIYIN
ncbi:FecR family protein [Dysgonomonas sp. 25]|uniref:FecR family protein n=1 Tax=Dysgonomonas sp. 25 TaxID=2302933 RepID=UPI0013D0BF50|nr:FecR family protein [Dysgonomonas sp. 25]NDV67976.1 FecR family protein [Dysgonomonas sp. 25]